MQETPRKGSGTSERILDVAEAAVLEKGFAATSIEEVIAAVGITKSGFFYHFKDKNELAKALLFRYVEREDALFDELFARADELNEDPLHGFLVRPQDDVRVDGRSAERASGRPRRLLLLSGPAVRQGCARAQRRGGA
jgi:AcrR family transcriptional regulator